MLIKWLIGALLVFMIVNLAMAGRVMLKPGQEPMSKFIGRRVYTSVAIVLLILIALAAGWITPNPRPY